MKKKIVKRTAGKTSSSTMYFNEGTHAAIVCFQSELDFSIKEKIYMESIRPAFEKLIDNLLYIHASNLKGMNEEVRSDCISFLYETLKKFDASRGSKAFSYFNVVAKNWIIVKVRQKLKYSKQHISMDNKVTSEIEMIHAIVPDFALRSQEIRKSIQTEQLNRMLEEVKDRLINPNDLVCIDAIIYLFDHIDDLDLFNKRAIFVYLREMTSLPTKQISSSISSIKKHYRESMKDCKFDIFI